MAPKKHCDCKRSQNRTTVHLLARLAISALYVLGSLIHLHS